MKLNTIQDLNRYLDQIPMFKDTGAEAARFELERFRKFCDELGKPYDAFPSIHVGGTNGKGSTCRVLSTVYHQAGFKVGMYTSPHLVDYRERFQVGGKLIPEADLLQFFNTFSSELERHELTYFEISTALAFWWFSKQEVDLAVIEVGLGGRLDATNIITAEVSIITNISLDHTDILGDTIEEIAREKAGIIKEGRPVVIGNVGDQARGVLQQVADQHSSALHDAMDLNPRFEENRPVIGEGENRLELQIKLSSRVQLYNIAVAWQVICLLRKSYPVSESQFLSALNELDRVFVLPGRFEKLHPKLQWYFDGAHNIEAVKELTASVARLAPLEDACLVLSMMKDKVKPEVLREFQKFKKIYYYTQGSKRAATIEDVTKWAPKVKIISDDNAKQIRLLKELESELVIFAGSFYFYSTVQKWLQTLHPDH